MSRYVKISTIAVNPPAENPGTGKDAVDKMVAFWKNQFALVLPDKPDLIIVPECCDRFGGHSQKDANEYLKNRKGAIRDFFASVAKQNNCHMVYPAIWQMPDDSWRNAAFLIDRNGKIIGQYNKNHPVAEGENVNMGIRSGRCAQVFQCDFGTVGFAICFDLNFEELLTQYRKLRPEMLLFPSMYHGGLMQAYWAYRCRTHFVSAVAGLPSGVISPVGHTTTTNYFKYVTTTINLDCAVVHLDYNWDRLKRMKEKYGADADFHDPDFLGSVLVSCKKNGLSVQDLIKEFGFELLDDYMARSLATQRDPKYLEQES